MLNSTVHETRLTRSRDGVLGGVCEGLGRRFGVNPNWIRLAWLAAVLIGGTGLLLYAVLWWILPREDHPAFEPVIWEKGAAGAHPPLARTAVDRKLLGVCGGLARRWELDPALVRVLGLALFVATGPVAVAAYLIAALVMPSSPQPLRTAPHPVDL